MKKIIISDYTLKELTKNLGNPLLFREKKTIAECIDTIGADILELPAVVKPAEDRVICRTISQSASNAAVAIPVGFAKESVAEAWACVEDAKHPILLVELPVSTVQMEYIYHLKSDKMLAQAEALVKEAKKYCHDVAFTALDATRADMDFLAEICEKMCALGVSAVTLSDDAGDADPDDIAAMVAAVRLKVTCGLYLKLSDKLKMAVANAYAGIRAGADGLKCSISGDNVLNTGVISDALQVKGDALGVSCGLKATEIHRDIAVLLQTVGKASVQASVENAGPDVFLDKDSTLSDIRSACEKLGYEISPDDIGSVYDQMMHVLERKDSIGARELEALVASSAQQVPSTYHLKSYVCTTGNLTAAMSHVILTRGEEELSGVAAGDGPIDSAFAAIDETIGHHYELDAFEIQAVTEGKEALGSALVRLRKNGKLYSGNGLSADIVGASIRAYINAVNKIVYEEN
ncbi:MAG: hypothetical protein IKR59_05360 [Lachnospiraceae bacterium]|nr:hypothetical protein [Lachnospiraceae bacterium]